MTFSGLPGGPSVLWARGGPLQNFRPDESRRTDRGSPLPGGPASTPPAEKRVENVRVAGGVVDPRRVAFGCANSELAMIWSG